MDASRAILRRDHATLWITAQGEFSDVRKRPVILRSGVGRLAGEMSSGQIIPIAIEYPFWKDSKPEVLIRFGKPLGVPLPLGVSAAGWLHGSAREWTSLIADALQASQDTLAAESQTRDPARFETLVLGRSGVGGIYDFGRRIRAWMRGDDFFSEHLPPSRNTRLPLAG